MSTRAAIYVRISQDRAGDAAGVARQEQDCRAVLERHGLELHEVYTDNDQSAFSGKARPAWTRLLADAADGKFDALVAWHDDRLWRNVVEQQTVFGHLASYGVDEVIVGGRSYQTASADDGFASGVLALVAQKESADKSRRLRRKAQEKVRAGTPNGGRRPYGYKGPDPATGRQTGMEVEPAEAEVIREVARRFLAGESLRSLCIDLNARGVPAARGGTWGVTSLRGILANPRYAALRTYEGEVVGPAVWPAILDEPTHRRLVEALGNPRRVTRGAPPRSTLAGLLRCGECGATLEAGRAPRRDGSVRRYLCRASLHTGGACGRVSVVAEPVEGLLRDAVIEALAGPGLARALRAAAGDDERQAVLLDQLRADESALEQVTRDHYVDRTVDRAQFLSVVSMLRGRIETTRASLARSAARPVLAGMPADVDGLRAAWELGEVDWRRAVIAALVDHVVVRRGQTGANRFRPDRLGIRWRA